MMRIFILGLFASALLGCKNTTADVSSGPSCSALTGVQSAAQILTASNVLPVAVGGHYINEITVSVTICEPGTSNCQTIPEVLLDTGSNGLRLFTCAVSLNLQSETVSGKSVGECVTYADTTSHWGPVKLADVVLGSEKASNVPIQIIDPSFASVPGTCTNLEVSPSNTGYNGIIGVGLLARDCGSGCTTIANNQIYFSCSGSTCNSSVMALSDQVTNPVSKMSVNNNGVILTLPTIGNGGAFSASGTLTLGINTASGNNTPGGSVVAYPTDSTPTFQTTFNGSTYTSAFIDSGSNALYFPGPNTLTQCAISGATFFCPSSPTTLSATQKGFTGSPTNAVSFTIGNASSVLLNNPNKVSSVFGGQASGSFDWGLPFFMGRSVYVGIQGAATGTALGTGPFWAY